MEFSYGERSRGKESISPWFLVFHLFPGLIFPSSPVACILNADICRGFKKKQLFSPLYQFPLFKIFLLLFVIYQIKLGKH
jgi:hypothetical protein